MVKRKNGSKINLQQSDDYCHEENNNFTEAASAAA